MPTTKPKMPTSNEIFEQMKEVDKSHRNISSRQEKVERHFTFAIGEIFSFVTKVYKLVRMMYERQNALEQEISLLKQNNLQKQ